MSDRRYAALATLFGLALTCTSVAGLRWLWSLTSLGAPIPLWAVCCQMLGMNGSSSEVTTGGIVLRSGLFAVGLYGMGSLARRWWKTRRFVWGLRLAAAAVPPKRLIRVVSGLGLSEQVIVIAAPQPLAFCFGLLRPRICISTGLIEMLTDAELRAVLWHENHHRRRFDPLRGLVVEALAAPFAFLPVAGELRDLMMMHAELAADRYAMGCAGRPALAGALHKILTHPLAVPIPLATGVSGLSATDVRIARLLDEREPRLHLSAHSLLSSGAIIAGLCMLTQIPMS